MGSSPFLLKVAEVLEQTASVLDGQESAKLATAKTARDATIAQLRSGYLETTGEELSDDVLQKLSSVDETALSVVQSMVTKSAEAKVARLGGSGEKTASGREEPRNARERAKQASDNFVNWIVS
jgi:hypothetical protein